MAEWTVDDIKPEDPLGRHVTWTLVTGSPGYQYAGIWTKVDAAWIDAAIKDQAALMADGFEPPAHREHEGEPIGRILSPGIRVPKPGGGFAWVVPVAWNDPYAPEKIAQDVWRYTSPKIGRRVDETGREYPYCLWELSITDNPYQVHLNPTHFVGAAAMPDPATPTNPQTVPGVAERLDAQDARITGIEEMLRTITAALEALKPPPAPQPEVPMPAPAAAAPTPEMAAMSAKLTELESDLRSERALRLRAEVTAAAPKHVTAVMSAEAVNTLISGIHTPEDAARVNAVFAGIKAPEAGAGTAAGTIDYTAVMGAGAGTTSATPPNRTVDLDALYNKCLLDANHDKTAALELYRSRRPA